MLWNTEDSAYWISTRDSRVPLHARHEIVQSGAVVSVMDLKGSLSYQSTNHHAHHPPICTLDGVSHMTNFASFFFFFWATCPIMNLYLPNVSNFGPLLVQIVQNYTKTTPKMWFIRKSIKAPPFFF